MACRILDRSARSAPSAGAGAGAAAGAASGAGGTAARDATTAFMSASTTLPPGPVPVTVSRSIPCSRASLRASGDANTRPASAATRAASAAASTSASTMRPPGPLPVMAVRSTPCSRASRRAIGEARTSPDGAEAIAAAGGAASAGAASAAGAGAAAEAGPDRSSGRASSASPITAIRFPNRNRLAFDRHDAPEHSACGGLELHHRLVRLDLRNHFVGDHLVAFLLDPADDGAFPHVVNPVAASQWKLPTLPPVPCPNAIRTCPEGPELGLDIIGCGYHGQPQGPSRDDHRKAH